MSDHDPAVSDLCRLRRGAHEFLLGTAPLAWAYKDEGGRMWELALPPDIAMLPVPRRFRVHARQEARRVARARLYNLDPGAARLAARRGAALRPEGREDDGPAAGPRAVTAPWIIRPPAASGFVRWQHEIGHNPLGAPVVACHWGPGGPPGSTWLAWWADSNAMATAYEAQARADGYLASFSLLAGTIGPLWYDHHELIRPVPAETADADDRPGPGAASPPGAGTSGLDLLRATIATWHLLDCPEDVRLTLQPPPADAKAADRAAGLAAGPVTLATASGQ
jgi:hypothetical protein